MICAASRAQYSNTLVAFPDSRAAEQEKASVTPQHCQIAREPLQATSMLQLQEVHAHLYFEQADIWRQLPSLLMGHAVHLVGKVLQGSVRRLNLGGQRTTPLSPSASKPQ